jgi:hypothetical protein
LKANTRAKAFSAHLFLPNRTQSPADYWTGGDLRANFKKQVLKIYLYDLKKKK